MTAHIFKNLVFEGVGTIGTAYAGVAQVLQKHGMLQNITRVAGTSSGSLAALYFGLNYSADEITENLMKIDYKMFLDKPPLVDEIPFFLKHYGRYEGNVLREWLQDEVAAKTGSKTSTFADIQKMKQEKNFKDIYMIGSNLSTGFSEIFSYDTTPDMALADAMRISMSLPLFFAAVRAKNSDVYVDGGVMNFYPITIFDKPKYLHNNNNQYEIDRYNLYNAKMHLNDKEKLVCNQETLGFRVESTREIGILEHHDDPPNHKIDGIISYLKSFKDSLFNLQNNTYLHSDDYKRTVFINSLGISDRDFDIPDEQKEKLVESGIKTTEAYLNSHQDQT